jgi:hypothetical protein
VQTFEWEGMPGHIIVERWSQRKLGSPGEAAGRAEDHAPGLIVLCRPLHGCINKMGETPASRPPSRVAEM